MSASHLTNSLGPKGVPAAAPPLHLSNLTSPGEAVRFLEYYRPAIESGLGCLGVFVLPDRLSFVSNDIQKLAGYAVELAQVGKDMYFHINLHDLPLGETFTHGKIETVKSAIGLFADIDARGPGRRKPLETLCPTVGDTIWVSQQFNDLFAPLCTAALIVSGYGCYPHILFKEPFVIETPEDRARIESLGRRFHAALHRIAAKRGWTGAVDYCDLAKVLRLPGCINWKDRTAPKRVQLQAENPTRFNLSDLEEVLPQIENVSRISGASTGIPTATEVNITLNPAAEISSDLLAAMAGNHPLFDATWNHRRPDLKDQTASGYDMALAGIGVACGFTDQQIADIIVHHRRNFPGKKQNRRGPAYLKYVGRTINLARQGRESSESAERRLAELKDALKSAALVDGTEDRAHRVGNSADTDDGPAPGSGSQSANGPGDAPIHQAEQPDPISLPISSAEHGNAARTGCTHTMEFVLAKVRKTGLVEPVYEHIDLLAGLSPAELAIAYQASQVRVGDQTKQPSFPQRHQGRPQ